MRHEQHWMALMWACTELGGEVLGVKAWPLIWIQISRSYREARHISTRLLSLQTGESGSSGPGSHVSNRMVWEDTLWLLHSHSTHTQLLGVKVRYVRSMWMKAPLASPSLLDRSSPFLEAGGEWWSLWAAWSITAVSLWHLGVEPPGSYANEWAWLSSSQNMNVRAFPPFIKEWYYFHFVLICLRMKLYETHW